MLKILVLAPLLLFPIVSYPITLGWQDHNPVERVQGYRVEVAPGPESTTQQWSLLVDVTGATVRQAVVTVQAPGEVCWRVRALAVPPALDSGPSNVVCRWVLFAPAQLVVLP